MEQFITSGVLVGSSVIAVAAGRGLLQLVLHFMAVAARNSAASVSSDTSPANL